MAGVKGKSGRPGRKTKREEIAIADLYNLSVRTVKRFLDGKAKLDKKVRVATEIVKRGMPQKIKMGGDKENPILIDFSKMTTEQLGKYLLSHLKE